MKSPSNNSALDAYIRETLKGYDEIFQPFDWSEVEVLLKHEQRSIPVEINKKTVVLIAVSAGVLILIFGIFKIVNYYSSLPAETSVSVDSTQNTFTLVDSLADSVQVPSGIKTDSIRIDTPVVAIMPVVDSTIVKNNQEPALSLPQQKKDKKKKINSEQNETIADSASSSKIIHPETPVTSDTISKPVIIENRMEVALPPDTTAKIQPTGKDTSKKKKSKAKNPVQPPAEQQATPPVIQSDSLKQQ